jgi:hypothetical protein
VRVVFLFCHLGRVLVPSWGLCLGMYFALMSDGEVNVSDPIIIGLLAKWGGPVFSLGIVVGLSLIHI